MKRSSTVGIVAVVATGVALLLAMSPGTPPSGVAPPATLPPGPTAAAAASAVPAVDDAQRAAVAKLCHPACMEFVVNVHDIFHVDESADTILRLIAIFSRHHVKGEFYVTGPMVALYQAARPDVITALKSSGMTISYHVRPPHPLVTGFDGQLRDLSDADLERTLRDYETYGLDLTTGELQRDRPGGYTLATQAFGTAPVTVVAPNADPRVRLAALRVYRSMGARSVMWYHEEGASLDAPLVRRQGLLVRPSDFSVTRWAAGGKPEQFWWNRLSDTPGYAPLPWLRDQLGEWSAARGPFVTALIHENNFYRDGAESWTLAYYADKEKTRPLPPPWTSHPEERSRVRSPAARDAIFDAYEDMVAWAAANMQVVTAVELEKMADTLPDGAPEATSR
jgi:hypothetical protein